MSKMLITTAAVAGLLLANIGGAIADGKGFDKQSGQGNLDNSNVQDPPNPGTTSISGPHGQVKKDDPDNCNNCTVDPPGNKPQ